MGNLEKIMIVVFLGAIGYFFYSKPQAQATGDTSVSGYTAPWYALYNNAPRNLTGVSMPSNMSGYMNADNYGSCDTCSLFPTVNREQF